MAYFDPGKPSDGEAPGKIKVDVVPSIRELEKFAYKFSHVAVDAPLSFPPQGSLFRKADILVKGMGVGIFPPVALQSMKKLTEAGVRLKNYLKAKSIQVYEIFPRGSAHLLDLDFKGNSRFLSSEQRSKAAEFFSPLDPDLSEEVIRIAEKTPSVKEKDLWDAILGLFTLWAYLNGRGFALGEEDERIIFPLPAVSLADVEEAELVERKNRFVLSVYLKGKPEPAHLRDTGRLAEYIFPGNRVIISRHPNPKPSDRTRYIVRAMKDPVDGTYVLTDPFLDPLLVKLHLKRKGVRRFGTFSKRFPRSTFDLTWARKGKKYVAEVKGASMHGDLVGFERDVAVFPDAYSSRAKRHFEDLAFITGLERSVFFVAHFPARAVTLNPAYPEICDALRRAGEEGVDVRAIAVEVWGGYVWVKGEVDFFFPPPRQHASVR